ncbi:MAG TPA: acyl-ACP--UDP-N-acetylglucosamine O-acyltransferase [Rhodospirillales bacterium]|jgi:UDP-N-acetylglucosamine acyltransferase|nr:MAG: acyl-[acyl-carrier-protein]--UDP-N-acetylglucosamine O-acyltransferase [Rhodospirillaceae bacterium]PPR68029.1 MAG: Acyl-[acyl-carrier-protein]--UDP-N-acetylglucosamine O-acyltransferase [Alphaproteobacteria bacterium MarineAlpha3_Bin1]PPR73962.1 MAG: Acyl-[acyl-carrier-protein]--UDP-N-acetylglucosamine O-acyltransferase [Alphaproteobacteria bacterium MarineAlpha3_Bin2]HIC28891.1 acyl-ACP--UDP-N-acetylglucosamine O-acyltransferase [Rhodospirillales bacterium]HIM76776.1 acyl-ACP--UDP-N-a
MSEIHPTAIIADGAKIGENVSIGPYSMVGSDVELDDGVELISHVVVTGHTSIGANTRIFPFASIGHQPQDLKYQGEASSLTIGCNNVIREYVTMNPGTEGGGMATRIGNNCLFMVAAHVAHDCQIADNVILVNNATLAGHVSIEDWAIIGGLSAVHQFVRIGKHSMIGGKTGVAEDVIPYGSVIGNRARLSGLNIVGLKRRDFSREDIQNLRKAYRLIFAEEGTFAERILDVAELFPDNEPVQDIINFINADSSRAICQPKMKDAA